MADKTFSLLAQLSLNDDAFKNSLKSVRENTKALIDGVEGVNGNLNEMRKALGVLNNTSFAGKSQEEIASIKKRIGELKEDMIDLKAQEKAMGMALVEVVPSALQGLTAIAEGVLGTAQLFGMSKENAEKLNSTMTQLIGISQALATIEQLRAERTIQILALKVKETIQTGYQTVANWANTTSVAANAAAIQAQAIITSEATIAAKAAAAAQWLWNTAILANPIVAIITAVAALTAGIYLLVKAMSSENDEVDRLNKNLDTLKSKQEELDYVYGQRINLLKSQGALTTEVVKAERDLAQAKYEGLLAERNSLYSLQASGKASDEQIKRLTELNSVYDDKTNTVIKTGLIDKAYDDVVSKTNQLRREEFDKVKQLNEELQKLTKQRENEILNFGKASSATTTRIKEIERELKLTEDQKFEISDMEAAIKKVIATGGVVSPQMINNLNSAYKETEKVNKEFDKLLKNTQGRDDTKLKPIKPIKGQVDETPVITQLAGNNLETDKLGNFTKKVVDGANKQKEAISSTDSVWKSLKANIADSQFLMTNFGGAIDSVTAAFTGLFTGAEGGFKNVVSSMLAGIQQILNALLAQAIAGVISKEVSSKGLIGLATAAAGVAILSGLWNSLVPKFATGGIVPGSYYSGDNVPIMVNSGEMILNSSQQENLFKLLNGSISSNNTVNRYEFVISGENLVGVQKNYLRKNNKTK